MFCSNWKTTFALLMIPIIDDTFNQTDKIYIEITGVLNLVVMLEWLNLILFA